MDTLRWGIIGIGNIVRGTMAPAMLAEPECELVAAVSRSMDRAEQFAKEFGAQYAYDSYDQMLANPDVDAVLVATPNAQHPSQVVAAARAGKHVLCDKPVALTVADALLEVEECRKANVRYGVNFHNRHLLWVNDVRDAVAAGTIGKVLSVYVEASAGKRPPESWRADPALSGLGTVHSQGVHIYDFLRVILGAEPVEVAAMFDQEGPERPEEEALVLLRFDNGALAHVNCNQRIPLPHNDIVIYGTEGRITGRNLTRSRIDGVLEVVANGQTSTTEYPSPGAHRRSLAAFTHAVLSGEEPNASGVDGLRSVQLCVAIATSVQERRRVSIEY